MTPISAPKMMSGKGRFINRPTQTGRHTYDKYFVYVPTEVARDGLFPFKPGDAVHVRIDSKGRRILVEKAARKPEKPSKRA